MRLACGPALACEWATRVRGGKRADVLGLVSRGERESGPAETDWAGTGFAWAERGREWVGRGERERAGPPEVGPGRGFGFLVLGFLGSFSISFSILFLTQAQLFEFKRNLEFKPL